MLEDLVTPYGILKPLLRDEISSLRRNIDEFEEDSGFSLAPYILDETFLKVLEDKAEQAETEGDSDDWTALWVIIHEGSTVVGCLDFSSPPGDSGRVRLRWTLNPEWIASPLATEAVRSIVDWAFERNECRTVEIRGEDRPFGDMAGMFRRLGFRPGQDANRSGEPGIYRLTKAVEGKLL